MLPCTPITEEVRLPKYVQEEWTSILSKVVNNAVEGWKSILYMNYAILNRGEAFNQLLNVPLDNGVSRAWALVSSVVSSTRHGIDTPENHSRTMHFWFSIGRLPDRTPTTAPELYPHQPSIPHRARPQVHLWALVANARCQQEPHVPAWIRLAMLLLDLACTTIRPVVSKEESAAITSRPIVAYARRIRRSSTILFSNAHRVSNWMSFSYGNTCLNIEPRGYPISCFTVFFTSDIIFIEFFLKIT